MTFHVDFATEPATADRTNEDFIAYDDTTLVLLDGAGTPPGSESGCSHGVPWFVTQLGNRLLSQASGATGDLTEALASAIETTAGLHRHGCDLNHPGSPAATVIIARAAASHLDYLVLADSTLVLDTDQGHRVITDNREADAGRLLRQEMDQLASGSGEHTRALRRYVEDLRARRNRPDGFWVASSDPIAAAHALTGAMPLSQLHAFAALSDGATRLVDRFHQLTWPQAVHLLADDGPSALIKLTRQAEASDPTGSRWPRGKAHDDATAAYCDCTPPPKFPDATTQQLHS